MDKQQETFPQQQAPEKNTDKAYVRVSQDGSPSFPDAGKEKQDPPSDKKETQEAPRK